MPIPRHFRRCFEVAWKDRACELFPPRPVEELLLGEGEELVRARTKVGRIRSTVSSQSEAPYFLGQLQIALSDGVETGGPRFGSRDQVVHHVLERERVVGQHDPRRQVEPGPLEHLIEDLSPAIIVAETNHPPEDSPIRSKAEDRIAQNLVEECIRLGVIVLHDNVPGLG